MLLENKFRRTDRVVSVNGLVRSSTSEDTVKSVRNAVERSPRSQIL